MGHYENIVKIEEMRRRMDDGDTLSAQKILDTMELKKIKNMSDLALMAEIYKENERYDEAFELYHKIYDKTKTRKSLFQLVDLSIKRKNSEDANHYLTLYKKAAPKDFYRLIFRYKIDKLKKEPYEVLIDTLKTLKKTEYIEMWAYELAKTYYKAGMEKECIQECSDIILWFGEGVYVEKAKILRSYFSGETDKDKLMEQLKQRSLEFTTTIEIPAKELAKAINQEKEQKEEVYITSDFMQNQSNEEFEDDLRKNVQDILTEELAEQQYHEEEVNQQTFEQDYIEDQESAIADEVEETIYQLLSEEDLQEEDRKLEQIANEFSINPEEIFGNFLHMSTVKKQLVEGLESILEQQEQTVQIMITGTEGSGKTTLAKDITAFLNKAGRLKSSKIAKIKAEKLNTLDLMTKKETLKDCCLVVENASELKRETVDSLLELCNSLQGDIAIVYEEDKNNLNQLFRECPKLMDLLNIRIHLPDYTKQDLKGFAIACIKQQNYQLSTKTEAIVLNKIDQIMKQSDPQSYLEQINILMQGAMNRADIRTGRQLSGLNTQERKKKEATIMVLPEDF